MSEYLHVFFAFEIRHRLLTEPKQLFHVDVVLIMISCDSFTLTALHTVYTHSHNEYSTIASSIIVIEQCE